MLNEICDILNQDDDLFYLYQFPRYLFTEYGEVAHTIASSYAGDDYMGLRTAHQLIDPADIKGKEVGEIGCNVGATSHELMRMEPCTLYSYDQSWKAISICHEVRQFYSYVNWMTVCAKFENTQGYYETMIWEDPHTASDDEIKDILTHVRRRVHGCVYFLECDNIYHLIKDWNLEQLSENSWKAVL
jgi:hypothetical protein